MAAPLGPLKPVVGTVCCAPRNDTCAGNAVAQSAISPIRHANLRVRFPLQMWLVNSMVSNLTKFPPTRLTRFLFLIVSCLIFVNDRRYFLRFVAGRNRTKVNGRGTEFRSKRSVAEYQAQTLRYVVTYNDRISR